MPLLYGEGGASFIRLQEEIIRKSDDHSIFAWKAEMPLPTSGILAQHPSFFASSGSLRPLDDWEPRQPYSMTNMGLGIDLPLRDLEQDASNHGVLCIAALACVHPQQPSQRLCIYLTALSASSNQFARTYADEWTYQATPSEARRIYIRQIPTSQHRAAPLTWQTFKLGAVEILEGHCANARGTLHLDLDSYEQSKEKGATYLGLLSSPGRHLYSGFRNRIVYSDMSHSLLQSWFVFATQDHSAHIIILFGLLSKEQLGFTVVKQTRAFIRSEARDMACWHLGALKPTGIWIKVQLLQKVLWVQPDARLREEPTKTAHYVRVTATRRQGQNLAFDISATIRTVEGPALAELTRPPEPHQYGRSLATCLDSARCLDEPSTDCIAHEEILNGLAESELLHAL
ncbi:hypothetical protein HII31_00476 [Pseudocercospora fuligena]|uniref:DUF8212 domain-containing protein n=1 Tax=Pseudocercospora fuligena TaxID=685502 RepID=A0A8H6RUI5_9PEZI|nr:hypothetical protein HII31_00476 [Pseudocercospora fuligena]